LEGLMRLQQPQVSVVQRMDCQFLWALVVYDDQNEVGFRGTEEEKNKLILLQQIQRFEFASRRSCAM
jgi:hypothetical protein